MLTNYYSVPGVCSAVSVGSTLSYLATDGLGSVTTVLSSSSASVTAQQLYGPYGNVRYASGNLPTAKGFTGQYADAATGLDYYRARYYDPVAGQFVSADPAGTGDGLNRYAYVGGNPETLTDPSGRRRCDDEQCGGAQYGRTTAQQWVQVFYQDALSSPEAAAALYLWSHQAWLQAENYAENVAHTSLMYQTGMGAVAYMSSRAGMDWGAGGTAQMEEFALLQTARAWAVEGDTGSMYDGAHALSMMHTASGGVGGASGVLGSEGGSVFSASADMLNSDDGSLGLQGGCGMGGESFRADTLVTTPATADGNSGSANSSSDNGSSSGNNRSGARPSGGSRAGGGDDSSSLQERPISSLRVGDAVVAYDPARHTTSVQTVQHVFIDHDTDLLDVTLRTTTNTSTHHNSAHDEVVHTTASHPWLTADRGWERAGTLRVGEAVVTANGSAAIVVALRAVPGAADMWDLTVSNVHTFVVGAGTYVVHNCTPEQFEQGAEQAKQVLGGNHATEDWTFSHVENPDTPRINTNPSVYPERYYFRFKTPYGTVRVSGNFDPQLGAWEDDEFESFHLSGTQLNDYWQSEADAYRGIQ